MYYLNFVKYFNLKLSLFTSPLLQKPEKQMINNYKKHCSLRRKKLRDSHFSTTFEQIWDGKDNEKKISQKYIILEEIEKHKFSVTNFPTIQKLPLSLWHVSFQ